VRQRLGDVVELVVLGDRGLGRLRPGAEALGGLVERLLGRVDGAVVGEVDRGRVELPVALRVRSIRTRSKSGGGVAGRMTFMPGIFTPTESPTNSAPVSLSSAAMWCLACPGV
jgi:hypothetical protein